MSIGRNNGISRQVFWIAISLVILPAIAVAQEAAPTEADQDVENTGQDPTKPLRRFDFRVSYTDLPNDRSAVTAIARVDLPNQLGDSGWKLNLRFDMPFVTNDVPSSDNRSGNWEFGAGDFLGQALLIAPSSGRWTYGVGLQAIFPTASEDQFGTGRYQVAPTVGLVYQLPEISNGSFVGVVVRNFFDVGGQAQRGDVNQLSIQPLFNISLPDKVFLTFQPDIRIDWEDGGAMFLPFDVTIGKRFGAKVVSLELQFPIVDDSESFEFKVEFRIALFF